MAYVSLNFAYIAIMMMTENAIHAVMAINVTGTEKSANLVDD